MNAHVLVPLKRLDIAKSRLAPALRPPARAELMRGLLARVLSVIGAAGFDRVTVVTSERLTDVERWHDRGLPWNEALSAAIAEVVSTEVVAIVSADLPLLAPDEVRALVEATPPRGIAIARALDGGTNAVSMRPPGLVMTRFGEPGSAAVHAGLGVPAVMVDLPGLAFDIDTPADLERMQERAA
jgi:2-phospho-L-lactate guanylyltransferase